MSRPPVGGRAVAIRNRVGDTIYVYGRGVYAGDHPVPHWDPDAEFLDGLTWRQDAERQVEFEMSQPQVEWVLRGRPTGMDTYGNPMGDTRTFAERVDARLAAIAANPRIDLDAGGSAWGYFCWWCAEETYEAMLAGAVEVIVALPDPLPHSLLTAPR